MKEREGGGREIGREGCSEKGRERGREVWSEVARKRREGGRGGS